MQSAATRIRSLKANVSRQEAEVARSYRKRKLKSAMSELMTTIASASPF
jgi:outer membrane protein assembly factor BamD (BamD/ComL family)